MGHNAKVPNAILLVIEVDLDFMHKNIHRKFEDRMKTITVRERTRKV